MQNSKIALVTGASRGIGKETAILLAKLGYQVCINYNSNQAAAQETISQIEANGGTAIAIQADIADEKQIVDMFQQIDQRLGPISALVNNAGILLRQATIEDMNSERISKVMQTNVTGLIICSREAVKRMAYKYGGNGGSIVNLSSRASVLGSPNEYIDYAASKGAVDSFTIGLAKEVANQGIRVNAVRPGLIYTDIHATGGEPERVERMKSGIPMQRGGYPEEVAEAIIWLATEKSSYTSGSFIEISGAR